MIAKMKKLTLAALRSDTDKLCRELVWLESVECSELDKEQLPEGLRGFDNAKDAQECEKKLQEIHNAIEVLSPYGRGKKKLIPEALYRGEFEALAEKTDGALELAGQVSEVTREISSIRAGINKAENDIASIVPFKAFDEPLGFNGTKCVNIIKGTFPKLTKLENVRLALDTDGFDYELCELGEFGDYLYVYAVVHSEDSDMFCRKLNAEGFARIVLTGFEGTAAEEIERLRAQIEVLKADREKCVEKLRKLAVNIRVLEEAYDWLSAVLETEHIKEKLCVTESACLLTGWVPEGHIAELEKKLDEFDCCYKLDEPSESDKVPVKLVNNKFAAPFESVLGLYSYPDYKGIDPTFVMSIFYFIIFGLIMQDVIYGLILLVGCKVLLKVLRSKPGTGMYKMLNMFSICGISTIVFGVLFGGYFGDLPSAIAINMFGMESFPDLAVALNPVTNPMPYLALSLGMGVLHLVAGMLMKAYMLIKRGHPLDALFDVGMWLVLFAGIGLLFVAPNIGKWVAIAGVAGLILTQGRAEKNIIMKLLKGIMSLYDTINYVSDLLSYSRIMALGLSGAIIAQVVNIIGTLGGASVVGFIVLILALALGHTLNLALSVLGAFVHTARLQYIEFLGKFFEDGGEEFKPSKIKTKYTEIAKEAK